MVLCDVEMAFEGQFDLLATSLQWKIVMFALSCILQLGSFDRQVSLTIAEGYFLQTCVLVRFRCDPTATVVLDDRNLLIRLVS